MGIFRAIFCILLPPLAVYDKGCGALLLTTILWLVGWVPGVIAAIFICYSTQGDQLARKYEKF